jgi:hypothetical protein
MGLSKRAALDHFVLRHWRSFQKNRGIVDCHLKGLLLNHHIGLPPPLNNYLAIIWSVELAVVRMIFWTPFLSVMISICQSQMV